jgi:hypothetical protein
MAFHSSGVGKHPFAEDVVAAFSQITLQQGNASPDNFNLVRDLVQKFCLKQNRLSEYSHVIFFITVFV